MTVPPIGLAIAIEGAGIGNILKPLGTLALNQPLQPFLFMHFGSVFPPDEEGAWRRLACPDSCLSVRVPFTG